MLKRLLFIETEELGFVGVGVKPFKLLSSAFIYGN